MAPSEGGATVHLVLVETSGNQNYIFATNKLRENIGASELTHLVGRWTSMLIETESRTEVAGASELIRGIAERVRQTGKDQGKVIVAASGKALVLVQDAQAARRVVAEVTRHARAVAPGLDVHGAISRPFDFERDPIHEVVRAVHDRHLQLHGRLPGPALRFLRLPVVAECATSGLPAACYEARSPEERKERSAASRAKRRAAEEGWRRLRNAAGEVELARSVDDLDRLETLDWLAVVHADGNGLGNMFLDFDKLVGESGRDRAENNRAYIEALGDFSRSLDRCTQAAFRHALRVTPEVWQRDGNPVCPLVPLVLGGDDLTLVCDGRLAIPFTIALLQEFERQTSEGIVARLAAKRRTMPVPRLAACAGVAIVKPHFPFFAAYSLAEALLRSAKAVKTRAGNQPASAFDFHIHHDASGADLELIRERLTVDEGATLLVSRPYVLTPPEDLRNLGGTDVAWMANHHLDRLEKSVRAVQARGDNDRRLLPNSLLHELREGLFEGREAADRLLRLALGRHERRYFGPLVQGREDRPSLFRHEEPLDVTTLLDAMDLTEFWSPE
jgi:hypothetical protein